MNEVCYEYGVLLMWTVMSASVLNVVCNEWVCYEYRLLLTWFVMKGGLLWKVDCSERGLLWTWSVMNMVCHEHGLSWTWSVMNVLC